MDPATLAKLKRIAKTLDEKGMRLELEAVRAVAAAYDGLSLADLIAMIGVARESEDFRQRVAQADRLSAAFRQAAARLGQPPEVLARNLRAAVENGATASAEMLAMQAGAPEYFDAFRIRPDLEIKFAGTAFLRLQRYWGIEQRRMADEVERALIDALEKGQGRQQIEARLRERIGVSRSRASLIARNELGNAAAYAMEQTQRQAGVSEYIWSAASDARTRPAHRARNGRRFSWDKPPADGHPGQPIQCRCAALAVLPDDWRTAGTERGVTPPPSIPAPVVQPPPPVAPAVAAQGQEARDLALRKAAADARAKLAKIVANAPATAQKQLPKVEAELAKREAAADEARSAFLSHRGRKGGSAVEKAYKTAASRASETRFERARLLRVIAGDEQYTDEFTREASRKVLEVKDPTQRIKLSFSATVDPMLPFEAEGAKAKVVRISQPFARYVARPDMTATVKLEAFSGRAHFDPHDNVIRLDVMNDEGVGVHELGHWLEQHDPARTGAQAQAFLRHRVAGKPLVKLADKYPKSAYGQHETAYDGAFDWSAYGPQQEMHGMYAAKLYGTLDSPYATEIMSIGLQLMHESPATFARMDPEFFDFVYVVMQGGTWKF